MAEILDATAADITAARDRLIVALDVPTVSEAEALIAQLGDTVTFFKVGLELVMNGGMKLVTALKDQGRQVFLDVKFLDIDTTVEKATANAARSGADFLTVHATDSKTLKAAARGAAGSQLRVLGVTVLTSLDGADLAEQGISSAPADLVVHRAKLAYAAGCHGVIASGQEAASVRQAIPDRSFAIVTPWHPTAKRRRWRSGSGYDAGYGDRRRCHTYRRGAADHAGTRSESSCGVVRRAHCRRDLARLAERPPEEERHGDKAGEAGHEGAADHATAEPAPQHRHAGQHETKFEQADPLAVVIAIPIRKR